MHYAAGMTRRFMNGEEVLYDGRRYVITSQTDGPNGVRLVAASGERYGQHLGIVYADVSELSPIESYTTPRADTDITKR